MGLDTTILAAMSALLNQVLAANESNEFDVVLAPLTDGRILLGREFLTQRTSPSRVVFVPVGGSLQPPNTKSQSVLTNGANLGYQNRILGRPLATDLATYEVYCWGQAAPADPEKDFDATRYLAHAVVQCAQRLMMASVHLGGTTEWTDQRPNSPTRLKAGHELAFMLSIEIPVTDGFVQFPPKPLTAVPTVQYGS